MGKLDGKVAIITGAGGGIGQAAARLFAAEGAKLMLVDLNEEALVTLAKSLGGNTAGYAVADVSSVSDVQAYLKDTIEQFGRVDITLLNAGIEGRVASISDQTEEDFDRVMAINTRGVWLGLKYTMPIMAKNGGGSIVITSSTAGIRAVPGLSPYIASKHAVIGLMRAGAMEGAKDKVRVDKIFKEKLSPDYKSNKIIGFEKNIKLQWDTKDINKSGIIGNPKNSSSIKGQKLAKVAISTIEKIIKELKLL